MLLLCDELIPSSHISYQISEINENGSRVLFWHDKWCGEQPLKVQFPNLFRIACTRDATVHELLSWNWGQSQWNITFIRRLNDWEEESILSLLSLLADLDVDVHAEGEDKIILSLESKGTFFVKSLCQRMLGSNGVDFPAKAIWKSKAPIKACFLAWEASKGKVPMEVMLKEETSI